nr:MAG TPA: hypothetical protein [Caudoviricetes sp.]
MSHINTPITVFNFFLIARSEAPYIKYVSDKGNFVC